MTSWRRLTVALLAATSAGLPQSGPTAHPDFSGTWKLNLQRSGPRMPRGLEALTQVIHHEDPHITVRETRVISGTVTNTNDESATIDGVEQVWHTEPGSTVKQRQSWSGDTLLKRWQKTVRHITYVSDIRQRLAEGGRILIMSEHYREPGLERIRDWCSKNSESRSRRA